MLRKILIANRGEIACRIIRTCREMGFLTVAVYSDADATALHVELADEAVLIGPAPAAQSYLNIPRLIEAALETGCDAIHPGYGFLSESADFAEAVIAAGLIWVGPPAEAIRMMGSKTAARALMEAAGVPVVPGYQDENASLPDFIEAAARIGYPIMVKATGGGGGKGIRIVEDAGALPEAVAAAQNEARQAFGDGRVFLERYIAQGRHVEIQVLADAHGHIVHLFERECSTQRRHQKIIEESPAPYLTQAQRERIGEAAVAAARAVGYVNAGTVEFILTPLQEFYFLEMNTRLQVEHPVTELVTGQDLVQLQLRIASGEALPCQQQDLTQQGHAIECRIYAEDPRNQFLPAVGTVLTFIPPQGPGIRVDSGIRSGDRISIHYDPMIAKLISYGPDRESAIARMQQALRQCIILGTQTNIDFLQQLLAHPVFAAAETDTRFVDRELESLLPPMPDLPDMALIAAALHSWQPGTVAGTGGTTALRPDEEHNSPWQKSDNFRMGQ